MEYVYAAMLLHKAGKEIKEDSIKAVLEAAGVKTDEARIKALVAALDGVNIDEAIEKATTVAAAPAAAPVADESKEEKKEDKKEEKDNEEDKKKSEESAAAGLGSLFG